MKSTPDRMLFIIGRRTGVVTAFFGWRVTLLKDGGTANTYKIRDLGCPKTLT
jgi:hypothetical protein